MPRIENDWWVTGAVIAGLLLVFGLSVAWPTWSARQEMQARIDDARTRLARVEGTDSELSRLEARVAELTALVDADSHFVPADPELGDLLRSLSGAVEQHGVRAETLDSGETRRYRDYTAVPVEVMFRGGFLQAAGALRSIENQRRLTTVDEVSLRVDQRDSAGNASTPVVRAELRLSTFFTGASEGRP